MIISLYFHRSANGAILRFAQVSYFFAKSLFSRSVNRHCLNVFPHDVA